MSFIVMCLFEFLCRNITRGRKWERQKLTHWLELLHVNEKQTMQFVFPKAEQPHYQRKPLCYYFLLRSCLHLVLRRVSGSQVDDGKYRCKQGLKFWGGPFLTTSRASQKHIILDCFRSVVKFGTKVPFDTAFMYT